MYPTKSARCGEDGNISCIQRVHSFFVSIEADVSTLGGNVDLILVASDQAVITAVHLVLKNIGHGDQLRGAVSQGN